MVETNNADASGTAGEGSADTNESQSTNSAGSSGTIAKEEFDKVVRESITRKNELKEAKAKLAELEKQNLQTKEDYKSLAELEKAERIKAEEKANKFSKGFGHTLKIREVLAEAYKAGLDKQNEGLLRKLDMSAVIVEMDDAAEEPVFEVKGTESFIAQTKKLYPALFKTPVAIVNSGGGNKGTVSNGTISWDSVQKAYADAKDSTGRQAAQKLFEDYNKQRLTRQ